MLRLFGVLLAAYFAATTVFGAELASPVSSPVFETNTLTPAALGKGTIGLVCMDSSGNYHFWNSRAQSDFDICVDQVVQEWTSKNGTDAPAESLIQGLPRYQQAVSRARVAHSTGGK